MTTDARVAQLEKKLAEDKDYREMRDYAKKLEKEVEGLRAALRQAQIALATYPEAEQFQLITMIRRARGIIEAALATQLPTTQKGE